MCKISSYINEQLTNIFSYHSKFRVIRMDKRMGSKFLVVAFLAILSIQGFAEAKHISVEPENVIGDAQKFIEQIKAAITDLIVNSIARVKNVFDKIMGIAQQELNKGLANIKELVEESLQEIKYLEELAEELGMDVKQCIEEQKPRIHKLAEETAQHVKECVAALAKEFQLMYENLLQATSDAYDRIFALVVEFDECKDVKCRAHVAKKLVDEMLNISGQVRILVDNSLRAMQEQIPGTVKCIKGQIAELKSELKNIVEDVKKCVADGHNDTGVQVFKERSIEENIKQLIEKLKHLVQDVVEKGVAAVKDGFDKLVKNAEELIKLTKQKIQELKEKLHKELEEIKEKAHKLGIDIHECVDEANPKIEELVEKTHDQLIKCINGIINDAKLVFDNVLALAKHVTQEVVDLAESIVACRDIKCFIDGGVNAVKLSFKITGEVTKYLADSAVTMIKSVAELTKCSASSLGHFTSESVMIANEFKQCFERKQK